MKKACFPNSVLQYYAARDSWFLCSFWPCYSHYDCCYWISQFAFFGSALCRRCLRIRLSSGCAQSVVCPAQKHLSFVENSKEKKTEEIIVACALASFRWKVTESEFVSKFTEQNLCLLSHGVSVVSAGYGSIFSPVCDFWLKTLVKIWLGPLLSLALTAQIGRLALCEDSYRRRKAQLKQDLPHFISGEWTRPCAHSQQGCFITDRTHLIVTDWRIKPWKLMRIL